MTCGDIEANPGWDEATPGPAFDEPAATDIYRQWTNARGSAQWSARLVSAPSGPSGGRGVLLSHLWVYTCGICGWEVAPRCWDAVTGHVCEAGAFEVADDPPASGRGEALLSCGDVESNPGPAEPSQGSVLGRRTAAEREALAGSSEDDTDLAHPLPPGVTGEPASLVVCPAGNEVHLAVQREPAGMARPRIPPASVLDILRCRVPTLRHVPGGLQADVTRILAGTIEGYVASPCPSSLFGVLAFPKLVLRPVRVRGKHAAQQQEAALRLRLGLFERGEWGQLWEALTKDLNPPGVATRAAKRARGDGPGAEEASRRRVEALVADGAPGKALQNLLSSGVHDSSDPAVLAKLRELNPAGAPPNATDLPERVDPALGDEEGTAFWEPLVRDSLVRFPRGTAPGPSGLRASHLQDAVRRPGRGALLVTALSKLARAWVRGELPQEHSPYLCGANLTPLRKKDGGVRPVAVGEVLRRLVGKALLRTGVCKEEVSVQAPVQVGVGVPDAVTTVPMGLWSLIHTLGTTGSWVALQVDLRNAFNSIDREAVLRGARDDCPSLYNFLAFAYGRPAPLLCGDAVIESQVGVHQGCPLGPVGFTVGLQPTIRDL